LQLRKEIQVQQNYRLALAIYVTKFLV
jgi:hypothetical protein